MSRDSRDEPRSLEEVLRAVRDMIVTQLPPGWAVMVAIDRAPLSTDEATIELWFDGEIAARFPVLFLLSPSRRDLARAFDAEERDDARPGIVVARYLSKPVRADLRQMGASYADATGNLWLSRDQPLIVMSRDGADSDPWRKRGRPGGSLEGIAAAQVIRVLADRIPPISLSELANSANVSMPTVYRFIDRFVEDLLVFRELRGPIVDVDWRELLVRWSNDAPFTEVNRLKQYLEPRGLAAFTSKLREETGEYAVTGSLAAAPYAPYADPRLAIVYTNDADQLAERMGLREVDAGSNVVLAEPRAQYVYEGSREIDGLRIVAQSQAVVDLMSGPGRSPSEGAELMDWMERNARAWRR